MRISSPNVVSPDEQLDEVVHHVVLDGSAEVAVVLGGDARIEAVEVAGIGVEQLPLN